jgi:hypothetical protein
LSDNNRKEAQGFSFHLNGGGVLMLTTIIILSRKKIMIWKDKRFRMRRRIALFA